MHTQDAKELNNGALRGVQIVLLGLIGVILTSESGTLFADETRVTLDTVVSAWGRSQKYVRSAKFIWTERITVPKGTIPTSETDSEVKSKGKNADERLLPLEDQILEGETTLSIDGDKWRYVSQSYIIDHAAGKLVPQKCDGVWNNGIIKTYMPPAGYDYPMGNINAAQHSDFPHVMNARPPFLIFRSLDVGLFKPAEYVLADKRGFIGDRSCVILETGPFSSRWAIWADPWRNYCILRETLSSNGKVMVKTDFSYIQDAQHGWIPSGWRIDEVDAQGKLRGSTLASVTQFRIANAPLDPREFELEFPPGTWVTDFTQRSDLGDYKQYIVREDGTKRIVNSADRGASYPRLLETETGQANLPPQPGWERKFLIALCAIVLITSATILLVKRSRARSKFRK